MSENAALTFHRVIVADTGGQLANNAALTAAHVIYADANGELAGEATLAKSRGGSAQDNSSLTFPATGTLATIAGVEVFTNKDIDGGTASNSSRITVPKASLATLAALTRKEGVIVYASDVDKLYKDDGVILTEIGSGGGGSINYILNPDAEGDVAAALPSGWVTYLDAAGTTPVNGVDGTAVSTFVASSDTTLRGTKNLLWTKSAANRQGEGFSYPFTISAADQAKVLNVSFDYIASSGMVVGSLADMAVWIYDMDNLVLIPVSPYQLQGNGTLPNKFTGTFQTNVKAASPVAPLQYRLIIHTSTVSAVAYTLRIDNVVVGPQIQLYGAPISDWVAYTPASTQGFGTVTSATFYYRRVGDSVDLKGRFSAGTVSSSELRISLPTGMTSADSTRIDGTASLCGYAVRGGAGAQINDILIEPSVTYVTIGQQASGTSGLTKATGTGAHSNSEAFAFFATVPVAGFSSTVLMSNDTDTRVVAAVVSGDAASATVNNPIIFPTVGSDTHSAYSNSTGKYTVPVSGYYQIQGALQSSTAGGRNISVYVDAVAGAFLGLIPASSNGTFAGIVKVTAGQLIHIGADGTIDVTANSNMSIFRLTGPSAIAVSESVNARYTMSAAQAVTTTATVIAYDTKTFDSHNAMSGGTFTCPSSGKYRVTASTEEATNTGVVGSNSTVLQLYKDGSNYSNIAYIINETVQNTQRVVNGSDIVSCVAGTLLKLMISRSAGASAHNTSTDTNSNYVCIERIGN